MDFTLKIFQNLLNKFLQNHYRFLTFHDYIFKFSNTETAFSHFTNSTTKQLKNSTSTLLNYSTSKLLNGSTSKQIILRHDVDRLPENSLQTAIIEHSLGIKGTYYFRVVPESYDWEIMERIAQLGHEIGYHYEDIDLAIKKYNLRITNYELQIDELINAGYDSFNKNLEMLRKNFDIKTICMHGSPRSKYDNKLIWTKYDYRDLGIIGEPYFDIDFTELAYYTDTGRRWNGEAVSVRDKVNIVQKSEIKGRNSVVSKDYGEVREQRLGVSRQSLVGSKEGKQAMRYASIVTSNWPKYRKTMDIIKAIEEGQFPQKAMITVHPQRWTDDPLLWGRELVWQNFKNIVKWAFVKIRETEKLKTGEAKI